MSTDTTGTGTSQRPAARSVSIALPQRSATLVGAATLSPKRRIAGVEVIDVLRVHEGRWYAACGGGGVPDHGVPFDPTTHPMRVRTVLDGLVVQMPEKQI